jgi:ABC-type branched-subunit amino acid transport system ATPase component
VTDLVGAAGLHLQGLKVAFGGVTAVDDLDLIAPPARLTALIGPNGAGKTTTFNACCGLVSPIAGRVILDGEDVTNLRPPARARRGLGRTFQKMELFASLTVAQNVALGREAGLAGSRLLAQFRTPRGERELIRDRVEDALSVCALHGVRDARAGSLSTGQRRLVELARVLAGDFRMLLLDEPSSGLDSQETRTFGELLRHIVESRKTGVLLVEHDMSLVMDVSHYIYVLDFGKLIFSGPPAEVERSDVVQRAYLGTEVA